MPEPERKHNDTNFHQSRELLIALVSAFQRSGHLPTADDIERYTEYKARHYEEQFGGLSNAYEEAGLTSNTPSEEDSDSSNKTESTNSTHPNKNKNTSILDSIGKEFDTL